MKSGGIPIGNTETCSSPRLAAGTPRGPTPDLGDWLFGSPGHPLDMSTLENQPTVAHDEHAVHVAVGTARELLVEGRERRAVDAG